MKYNTLSLSLSLYFSRPLSFKPFYSHPHIASGAHLVTTVSNAIILVSHCIHLNNNGSKACCVELPRPFVHFQRIISHAMRILHDITTTPSKRKIPQGIPLKQFANGGYNYVRGYFTLQIPNAALGHFIFDELKKKHSQLQRILVYSFGEFGRSAFRPEVILLCVIFIPIKIFQLSDK